MAVIDGPLDQHLTYALQLSIGLVFLLAVIPKIRDPATFLSTFSGYHLAPQRIARIFAWGLIADEFFLAVAFLTGWLIKIALPLAAMNLSVFATAVAINLGRGRRVPCGCFGDSAEEISNRTMVRLGLLLAAVVILAGATMKGVQPVDVAALAADGGAALPYLLEEASLAIFLVVVSLWLLTLPELLVLALRARGIHQSVPPPKSDEPRNEP